jgi:hypothetical protein
MRTRRAAPGVFAALLVASAAFAQAGRVEKGSRDDLKGARTVFVDAIGSPELRDVILSNLETELPELHFTTQPDEADLLVRFETTPGRQSRPAPVVLKGGMTHQSNPDHAPGHPGAGPVATGDSVVRAGRDTSTIGPPGLDFGPITTRYGFGSVLRVVGGGRVVEAIKFRQPVFNRPETVARDFARKLAKEFRKANGIR